MVYWWRERWAPVTDMNLGAGWPSIGIEGEGERERSLMSWSSTMRMDSFWSVWFGVCILLNMLICLLIPRPLKSIKMFAAYYPLVY